MVILPQISTRWSSGYSSIEYGLDDMFALKTFFQSVLHCVALDEIIPSPYSLAKDFDIHTKRPFVNEIVRELPFVPAKLLYHEDV